MSDIFVPIDHTDLKEVIPPGENITYSTLCNVVEKGGVGPTSYKKKYKSHVLVTNKGIAFTIPKWRKEPKSFYMPLDKVRITKKGKLSLSVRREFTSGLAYFVPVIAKEYESAQSFKEREPKFGAAIIPLIVESYKETMKIMEKTGENPRLINLFKKQIEKYDIKLQKY
jgi:hypothetical protein